MSTTAYPRSSVAANVDTATISRLELVERLGEGAGGALFERIDDDYRRGERVILTSVREARDSFSAARTSGHARLVKAQRPAKAGQSAAEDEMVLIGLRDFEAVVKAGAVDFSWAVAFAPRPGLLPTSMPVTVRSGARGQTLKL